MNMTIERIKVGPRMSQAVIHGATVYLAGQVADDPSADVAGQTRQILAKIDGLLAEAGTDKSMNSLRSYRYSAFIAFFARLFRRDIADD
jgi:enamine deaminase RidA (YjgF/YER057c/UK114 family)